MERRRNIVQGKSHLYFIALAWLACGLYMGCHSGPSFTDDTAYRAIEREADRNSTELALTGADIAAHVERIDDRAARVQSELINLKTGIGESTLPGDEKSALLLHTSRAREESGALIQEVSQLRENTRRLNDQLVEQRKKRRKN
jgi:hypothetical protein